MRIIAKLLVLLALPSIAVAEPFWCGLDNGKVSAHPLSFETLTPMLNTLTSEVGKIVAVKDELNAHIALSQTPDDSGSIIVFNRMVEAVTDVSGPRFLSTEMFRFEGLFGFGVDKADCDGTAEQLNADRPALYAIYEAAEAIKLIGRASSLTNQADVAQLISANYSSFDAWLLTDGLPQWPWELWLNGKTVDKDIQTPPPLWQWILARPSAGIDLSYARQEDADAVPSFGIEVVGLIKYRDHTYKKHIGASLLATVGTDDGAGYGIALRWNGFWAGYVIKEGSRADAVYLGFDLYKVLQDDQKRKQLAEDFAEAVVPMFSDISSLRQ